ncbi:hypothetical protein [Vibrio rotiferianus]|uniref:hypothetical protein n=1 Tax=Vibrio rotiferianus TaxID=190895 RepID=UPI00117E2608|nr:hypothetical protein [Vibrio rotiferianus]
MKQLSKMEVVIYWLVLVAYVLLLNGVVILAETRAGQMLEGALTVLIFLSAFFSVCQIIGEHSSSSHFFRPRQVPVYIDLVLLLITGFVGWQLDNFIVVFSCLISVLILKKIETIRQTLHPNNDDSV